MFNYYTLQDRPARIERLREEERRLARQVQREREIIERLRVSPKNKNYNNYNNSFLFNIVFRLKKKPLSKQSGTRWRKNKAEGYEDGRNL